MTNEEFKKHKRRSDYLPPAQKISKIIEQQTGIETRIVIPGHILRGGSPSAYDRTLATGIGAYAAKLIKEGQFGVTVSVKNNELIASPLEEIAHRRKVVTMDHQMIKTAEAVGISFGNQYKMESDNHEAGE